MTKIFRALSLAVAFAITVSAVTSAHWPVQSRYSYMSQRFNDGHRGIDISASYGTGVVPITSGTVVFAGYRNNCGGYQVWVRHSSGLYSAYYHMSREITYSGEYVTGEVERIGYVGTSGCVTGAHVHVEVWIGFPWRAGSYRVNPWNYVDHGYWLPYQYR